MNARRGIIIVVTLIVLGVAASVAGIVVLSLVGGAPASVPESATLYLKIQAPFNEIATAGFAQPVLRHGPTLRSLVETIHKAKVDSRVKVLVIEPESAGSLWGQVQEVRAALEDYKTSGKPLVAFMEFGGAGEYYLASAADRIVLMPAGELDVEGIASYEVFFRGALDKIGVVPDLLHIGDYKTATNTFTEKGFTPAHREMTQSLNRDWYNELVRGVGQGRKMADDAATSAVDGGPYLADAALKAGLVDELGYADQLESKAPIKGTQAIQADDYARVPVATDKPGSGGEIALLYAVGTITSGKSSFDAPSGAVLGSETFNAWVRKVRVDPDIRAVVVRIDSPGGSAIASEVMWRELMLTRDVKPVIVSMGDVAASGGYYIATPAQTIVAEPGTLTGSIGVVTGKFVVSGALDKLGVGTASASDGPFAEIDSPFRPFTTDERARVEEQMHATYELFVKRVADGRHQTPAKIDARGAGPRVDGPAGQGNRPRRRARRARRRDSHRETAGQARSRPRASTSSCIRPSARSTTFFRIRSDRRRRPASSLFLRSSDARMIESAAAMLSRFHRGEPLAIMPNVFMR